MYIAIRVWNRDERQPSGSAITTKSKTRLLDHGTIKYNAGENHKTVRSLRIAFCFYLIRKQSQKKYFEGSKSWVNNCFRDSKKGFPNSKKGCSFFQKDHQLFNFSANIIIFSPKISTLEKISKAVADYFVCKVTKLSSTFKIRFLWTFLKTTLRAKKLKS